MDGNVGVIERRINFQDEQFKIRRIWDLSMESGSRRRNIGQTQGRERLERTYSNNDKRTRSFFRIEMISNGSMEDMTASDIVEICEQLLTGTETTFENVLVMIHETEMIYN